MWIALALLSAIFAALTAILAKIGLQGVNSHLGVFIRTLVALFLALGLVFLTGGHKEIPFLARDKVIFLVLSGLCTGLSWLCYYQALKIGPASKVAPIDKLSVVLVIILAAIFLKEPLTLSTIIGSIFLVAGVLIIL
jgi:transporter family protein